MGFGFHFPFNNCTQRQFFLGVFLLPSSCLLDSVFLNSNCAVCADAKTFKHENCPFDFFYATVEGLSLLACKGGLAAENMVRPRVLDPNVMAAIEECAKGYTKLQQLVEFYHNKEADYLYIDDYEKYSDEAIGQAAFHMDFFTKVHIKHHKGKEVYELMVNRRRTREGVELLHDGVELCYSKALVEKNIASAVSQHLSVLPLSFACRVANHLDQVAKLETYGVKAIIGDGGYMSSIEAIVASQTKLPVLLTPHSQLTFMIASMGKHRLSTGKRCKVLICTSDGVMYTKHREKHVPAYAQEHWDRVQGLPCRHARQLA